VRRRGDDTKFVARVLAIGPECDIALLAVDDESFWRGPRAPPAVAFGATPRLQDDVTVVGYPIGGDSLSVTSGVASRIEVRKRREGGGEAGERVGRSTPRTTPIIAQPHPFSGHLLRARRGRAFGPADVVRDQWRQQWGSMLQPGG
jgi:hypothetical protein